ncbi:MAG: cytochrome c3 family protein [Chloroflexi bacterium]|nr:cytochrome c3 family protein [Chloroflexota bacterium]
MLKQLQIPSRRPIRIFLFVFGAILLLSAGIILVYPANASPLPSSKNSPQNEACLTCHNRPDFQRPMPSGETLSLTIDRTHFRDSAHSGISCTDCHTNISSFPHPALTAQNLRDVSLQFYTICQTCHADQYDQTLDSVHQKALAAGNTNAAICTDCHNPHTQPLLTDSDGSLLPETRSQIPQTCAQCHSAIYDQYEQSVHGAALTLENNLDVPTCIDCHGIHNIEDPTTASFRLKSPQLCATCHTDATIMDKYGISTSVLGTYVADFHGTTVTLFETQSPDQATNKPVCVTCHGIHNIKRVDDPVYGLEMKQNLLARCQTCHPDATSNFPDAWMSHFIPSPEHYPIVYYVTLFYKFFIPGILGPMAVFVVSDIVRRLIERRKGAKHA